MFHVQKSPVERDLRQLNRQEAQEPIACNRIPNVSPGCDAILDSSTYLRSDVGIRQQFMLLISVAVVVPQLLCRN